MANNNIYTIVYPRLTKWLMPTPLRQPVQLAFMNALASPTLTLYQDFLSFRKQTLYALGITPQVCYLQKLLNDKYDFTQRRIYIADSILKLPQYIFEAAESKPVYLFEASETQPVTLYTDNEAGSYSDDFVVFVPSGLTFNKIEMKALLKQYKLASKRFSIQSP